MRQVSRKLGAPHTTFRWSRPCPTGSPSSIRVACANLAQPAMSTVSSRIPTPRSCWEAVLEPEPDCAPTISADDVVELSPPARDVPSNGGVQSDLAPFAKQLPRLAGRFSMVIKSGAAARTFRQPDLPDWPMFDRLPVFLVGQRVNTHRVNILRRQAITSRQKGVICDAG